MSPRNQSLLDLIAAAGPGGISIPELTALSGLSGKKLASSFVNCRDGGGAIYTGGPTKMRRYFASKADAEAWDVEGRKRQIAISKETARLNSQRQNVKRAARNAAARASRSPFAPQTGKPAGVQIRAPRVVEIITPEHIKIQRGAPWTHDIRYQVAPGVRIRGQFLTEWHERRNS